MWSPIHLHGTAVKCFPSPQSQKHGPNRSKLTRCPRWHVFTHASQHPRLPVSLHVWQWKNGCGIEEFPDIWNVHFSGKSSELLSIHLHGTQDKILPSPQSQ